MSDKEFFDINIKILEREQDFINQLSTSNHTNWDTQIVTLSMAALGFSFSLLDNLIEFKYADCGFIFTISAVMFVLAIATTMVNYWFSDEGLKSWRESNDKKMRSGLHAIVESQIFHSDYEKHKQWMSHYQSILTNETDPEKISKINQRITELEQERKNKLKEYAAKVDEIFENQKEETTPIQEKMNGNNKIVNALNTTKTLAFISGVVFLTIYVLANI